MANLSHRIRLGLVGANFSAQVHAPAFRMDPRAELVGIAATSMNKAQSAATALGIEKAFGDWRNLFDDAELDAVAIAVPPEVQPTIALAALDRGLAVFTEKPLAATVGQAEALANRAAVGGVANMVDFEFYSVPAWITLRSMLHEGLIGTLRHVVVTWHVETRANRAGLESWKTRPGSGGGTLYNFVSHTFHYLEWLCGPVGGMSCRLFSMPGDIHSTDTLDVLSLRFVAGASASVSVGTDSSGSSGHRVQLFGSDGELILENKTRDYARGFRLYHRSRGQQNPEPVSVVDPNEGTNGDGRILPVASLACRFLDWIIDGRESEPDFATGLRVQRLLYAAQRANAEGRWVNAQEF